VVEGARRVSGGIDSKQIIIAILVQSLIFGVFFYIDARQIILKDWRDVVRFGLHPVALAFYALTPVPLWWTYRQIYQSVNYKFWRASLIQSAILQIVYLIANYTATKQIPSRFQAIGLLFNFIAVLIASY
jgi:hypothetical protein